MTYDRRIPAHPALIGGMLLMALAGYAILYAFARDRSDEVGGSWVVTVCMIVLPLVIAAFHVRVRFTGASSAVSTLTLALWPLWRRHIPVERITSAETVTVRAFGDFGGIGLRFNTSGELGLLMRSGRGVRVTTDDGRVCTVVVPDPEELLRRLETARPGACPALSESAHNPLLGHRVRGRPLGRRPRRG